MGVLVLLITVVVVGGAGAVGRRWTDVGREVERVVAILLRVAVIDIVHVGTEVAEPGKQELGIGRWRESNWFIS